MRLSFSEDLKDKLKQIGWFVAVRLLRWLLERLVGENPSEGEKDVETKH